MPRSSRTSPLSLSSLAVAGLFSVFPAAVRSQTSAFTDQATGIQFQRFFGARTNFGFGVALSTNTTSTSFIGQLTFPLANGNGWGGFSLTGDMEGPLLVAAWYCPLSALSVTSIVLLYKPTFTDTQGTGPTAEGTSSPLSGRPSTRMTTRPK